MGIAGERDVGSRRQISGGDVEDGRIRLILTIAGKANRAPRSRYCSSKRLIDLC